MPVLASSIIERAATLIQDSTYVRWTVAEWLNWLNDGQREVVMLAPDAYTLVADHTLVEGTLQSIPADGIRFVDTPRNMGLDGLTPGKAIRQVDRIVLDTQRPDWHSEPANASVMHTVFDKRNPKKFYVYPPQPAVSQGHLELVYSASPPEVSPSVNPPTDITDFVAGDVLTIDDIRSNALLNYMLYRAYSKDAEYAANAALAAHYYKAFATSLQAKEMVDAAVEPTPPPPNV